MHPAEQKIQKMLPFANPAVNLFQVQQPEGHQVYHPVKQQPAKKELLYVLFVQKTVLARVKVTSALLAMERDTQNAISVKTEQPHTENLAISAMAA